MPPIRYSLIAQECAISAIQVASNQPSAGRSTGRSKISRVYRLAEQTRHAANTQQSAVMTSGCILLQRQVRGAVCNPPHSVVFTPTLSEGGTSANASHKLNLQAPPHITPSGLSARLSSCLHALGSTNYSSVPCKQSL